MSGSRLLIQTRSGCGARRSDLLSCWLVLRVVANFLHWFESLPRFSLKTRSRSRWRSLSSRCRLRCFLWGLLAGPVSRWPSQTRSCWFRALCFVFRAMSKNTLYKCKNHAGSTEIPKKITVIFLNGSSDLNVFLTHIPRIVLRESQDWQIPSGNWQFLSPPSRM